MKNLVFLILFFITTVCSAQIELESNKEGVYRIKEDTYYIKEDTQGWVSSGVIAEFESVDYIDKFFQAINNPGTPVLVEREEKILKLRLVLKELIEVKEGFTGRYPKH